MSNVVNVNFPETMDDDVFVKICNTADAAKRRSCLKVKELRKSTCNKLLGYGIVAVLSSIITIILMTMIG